MTPLTGNGWEIRPGRWQDSPPDEVDHVITDPPYDQATHAGARHRVNGEFVDREYISFAPLAGGEVGEFVRETLARSRRWCLAFCAIEQAGEYRAAVAEHGGDYVRTGWAMRAVPMPQLTGDRPGVPGDAVAIYHRKGRKAWNGGGTAARWDMPQIRHTVEGRNHETEKPIEIMLRLVELFTAPGDLVWDPYGGSQTTGVACVMLGRRYIGHEVQARYVEVGAERLRAAEQGQTLRAARAGQMPLFGGARER